MIYCTMTFKIFVGANFRGGNFLLCNIEFTLKGSTFLGPRPVLEGPVTRHVRKAELF